MLKTACGILVSLAMVAQAAALAPTVTPPPDLRPEQQQAHIAHLAVEVISRYHYQALPLDDAMSERIFDHYLKSLDAEKLFFVQADIDRLAGIRTRLDDAILNEDLDIFFVVFNFYAQRVFDRIAYARSLLPGGFDFGQQENYQSARGKQSWPGSEAEMRDLWRKQVKNDWLRLKLSGKDDQYIAATLDRRYDNTLRRIGHLRSEDVFQTLMNAYTMAIEPHTTFKGPRAAEDSGILMKLSMVGIGLVLTEKDGCAVIRELASGGPAALSGQLAVGDRIVGVAQGDSDAPTDVQGWRLDDIVTLIRGTAGSVVRLDVLPAQAGPDGERRLVALMRQKIALAEQYARKSILSVTDGKATRRVGVISLPSFYQDFEARQKGERNFRSASHDMARLLAELKADKVDSVLIDLRNNGGGSLSEAIELTGLFVGNGPVVQQRDAMGKITVERDTKAGLAWDGPLGVLINRGSASASEIFAAAIQDYGRGLVIGETSYGKGTVQAIFSLDQAARKDQPKLGELRLTIAQFFRVNGGSTQLRGVEPDVPLPATIDRQSFGESSFDNPLPWIQIKAAEYSPAADLKSVLPILLRRHAARVKVDRDFRDLREDIAEFESQRARNLVSLNEGERRLERDAAAARVAMRQARRSVGNVAAAGQKPAAEDPDDGLQANERHLGKELASEKARKTAKDIFLSEAAKILDDAVSLVKPAASWTRRVKPDQAPTVDQQQGAPALGSAFHEAR